jgi:hypothetical protein
LDFFTDGLDSCHFVLLPHAQCTLFICYRMHSVRFQFVTACVVNAYNWFPHAQYCIRLQSTKYLEFFIVYTAHTLTICYRKRAGYAYNLLKHAPRVCLKFATACALRRACLQFATACLEYANKANHTQILPFQLNQVKTYEKSKKSKKLFVTHSSGPQGNQK